MRAQKRQSVTAPNDRGNVVDAFVSADGKGMVKRETGVNPVRARHCDKGVWIRILVTDAHALGRPNLYVDLSARKPASCLVPDIFQDHELLIVLFLIKMIDHIEDINASFGPSERSIFLFV